MFFMLLNSNKPCIFSLKLNPLCMKKYLILAIIPLAVFSGCRCPGPDDGQQFDTEGGSEWSVDDFLQPVRAADIYNDSNRLEVEKGTVLIKRAMGGTETVEDEVTVSVGDAIKVSENSRAVLYWFDDSISRLAAGSIIKITEADYNVEDITETDINFEVVSGEVWSKVINLVDEDSEFLAQSGSVVAGVRGTTFNVKAGRGGVEVESIDHAAIVNLVNPKTGKVIKKQTITKGKKGYIKTGRLDSSGESLRPNDKPRFEFGMIEIPKDRFRDSWFKDNQKADVKAAEEIADKQIKRMKERIGALPGDSDYEEKQRLIAEKMAEVVDPALKAEMEARIAQLRANELMVQMHESPDKVDPEEMKKHLDEARDRVRQAGIDDAQINMVYEVMQQEMRVFDRAFEDILPGEKELYEAKRFMREHMVELEVDPAERVELEEMLFERSMYELQDFVAHPEFDPEDFEGMIEDHMAEFEQLRDQFEQNQEFIPILGEFINEIDEFEIDPELIRGHQEFLEQERLRLEENPPEDMFFPNEEMHGLEVPFEEMGLTGENLEELIPEEYFFQYHDDPFVEILPDDYVPPEDSYFAEPLPDDYAPPEDYYFSEPLPDDYVPPEEYYYPEVEPYPEEMVYPEEEYIAPEELDPVHLEEIELLEETVEEPVY